mgnify:CR=1 FL=1
MVHPRASGEVSHDVGHVDVGCRVPPKNMGLKVLAYATHLLSMTL